MDRNAADGRVDPLDGGRAHGRRGREQRLNIPSLIVATIVLSVLIACSPSTRPSSPLAQAQIDSVRFLPGAGASIAPAVSVSAFFDYRIAPVVAPVIPPVEAHHYAGHQQPDFFAVLEARAADDRILYLDACGRDARRALESTAGSMSLTCAMRLAEPATDHEDLILQVRIYQRTGNRRSVTIGSSPPVRMRRARTIFTPLDRAFMTRCPHATDRNNGGSAAVTVCRG